MVSIGNDKLVKSAFFQIISLVIYTNYGMLLLSSTAIKSCHYLLDDGEILISQKKPNQQLISDGNYVYYATIMGDINGSIWDWW